MFEFFSSYDKKYDWELRQRSEETFRAFGDTMSTSIERHTHRILCRSSFAIAAIVVDLKFFNHRFSLVFDSPKKWHSTEENKFSKLFYIIVGCKYLLLDFCRLGGVLSLSAENLVLLPLHSILTSSFTRKENKFQFPSFSYSQRPIIFIVRWLQNWFNLVFFLLFFFTFFLLKLYFALLHLEREGEWERARGSNEFNGMVVKALWRWIIAACDARAIQFDTQSIFCSLRTPGHEKTGEKRWKR